MSHPRLSLPRRAFAASLGFVLFAVLGVAACGRSDLNDYLPEDGGLEASVDAAPDVNPDGGRCNATTCPSGCCDASGQCQAGTSKTQCGVAGESCQNCQAEGFQFCDQTRHACGSTVTSCGTGNCTGCCEGTTCFAGSDPNECGGGGVTCKHCQSAGLACVGDQCVQQACGPQNCKGCCFGQQCVTGTDQTACGSSGQQCANCAGMKETCVSSGIGGTCQQQATCGPGNCPGCCVGNVCMKGASNADCGLGGHQCQNCAALGEVCGPSGSGASCFPTPPPPTCSPQSCPTGCCDASGKCVAGTANLQCGGGGAQCQDCAALNESCQKQTCVNVPPPVCNAQNCPGCCDVNSACQPGFVDGQCGQNGTSCADCTALAPPSTCDVNVTPRACTSRQTQCPSPYPSCPANMQTPTPTTQHVCSPGELQNAASACSAGAHSTGCQSFFSFEASQNPACGTCLSAFDYNFAELRGLFECVAPFVGSSCNHDTACIVDCTDQSCAMCSGAGATSQCQSTVRNGQCSSYYQGAQCIGMAFFGQGSFCNPNAYQGNYGGWLAGVGKSYCAQ